MHYGFPHKQIQDLGWFTGGLLIPSGRARRRLKCRRHNVVWLVAYERRWVGIVILLQMCLIDKPKKMYSLKSLPQTMKGRWEEENFWSGNCLERSLMTSLPLPSLKLSTAPLWSQTMMDDDALGMSTALGVALPIIFEATIEPSCPCLILARGFHWAIWKVKFEHRQQSQRSENFYHHRGAQTVFRFPIKFW